MSGSETLGPVIRSVVSEKRRRESMLKAHAVGDGAAAGRAMAVGRVGLQVLFGRLKTQALSFIFVRFLACSGPSKRLCHLVRGSIGTPARVGAIAHVTRISGILP